MKELDYGVFKPLRYTVNGGLCDSECKLMGGFEYCKHLGKNEKCKPFVDTNYLKTYISSYFSFLRWDYSRMASLMNNTAPMLVSAKAQYDAQKPLRAVMTQEVFSGENLLIQARPLFKDMKALVSTIKYWLGQTRNMTKALNKVAKYKYMRIKGDCNGLPGYKSEIMGNGLVGRYYNGTKFEGLFEFRLDSTIDYFWNNKQPIRNISPYFYGIEWIGYIKAPITDRYTFYLDCDAGCYMVLNDKAVIQDRLYLGNEITDFLEEERKDLSNRGLRDYSRPTDKFELEKAQAERSKSDPVSLTGGKYYPVRIRFVHSSAMQFHDLGMAFVKLSWSNTDLMKQVVQKEYLYEHMESSPFVPKGYDARFWKRTTMEENSQAFMDDKTWRLKYIPYNSHGNFRLMTLSTFDQPELKFTLNATSRIYLAYPATLASPPVSGFSEYNWDMALLKVSASKYDDMLSGKQLEAADEEAMKVVQKVFQSGTINIQFTLASPTKLVVWIGYVSESLDNWLSEQGSYDPLPEDVIGEEMSDNLGATDVGAGNNRRRSGNDNNPSSRFSQVNTSNKNKLAIRNQTGFKSKSETGTKYFDAKSSGDDYELNSETKSEEGPKKPGSVVHPSKRKRRTYTEEEEKVIKQIRKYAYEHSIDLTKVGDFDEYVNTFVQGNINKIISKVECSINSDSCINGFKKASKSNYWSIPEFVTDHVAKVTFDEYVYPKYIVLRMKDEMRVAKMEVWYDLENRDYEELESVNKYYQAFMLEKAMPTKTLYLRMLYGDRTAEINVQIYGTVIINNKVEQKFDENKLIIMSKRNDEPNTELLYCTYTLSDLRAEIGSTIKAVCAEECDITDMRYMVFGETIYHDQSNVCLAAQHMYIEPKTEFLIKVDKPLEHYPSKSKNGITSLEAFASTLSFEILPEKKLPVYTANQEIEVIDDDLDKCYVRAEYLNKVDDETSNVKIGNRVKSVATKLIGKCGERILGPCRDTNSLVINFIDPGLKSTISQYQSQLQDQIVDYGDVYRLDPVNYYEYGWELPNKNYGVTTSDHYKLKDDIKSYSGIVLSPTKKSKYCKNADKSDECKQNKFKIKLANGFYEITVQVGNIDQNLSKSDKVYAFVKINGVEFFYKKQVPFGTFINETKKVEVDEYELIVSNPCKFRPECEFDYTQLVNIKIKSINSTGNSPYKKDLGFYSFRHNDCFTEEPLNCIYRQSELSSAPECPNMMKLPNDAQVKEISCDYKCYALSYDYYEECKAVCVPSMKCVEGNGYWYCKYK
eukprot:Mrub_00246.p1 GENE.Mrub_00246~~Mrub_00246.p1  ORF type:complete len:1287 (+),score=259.91 Mrub_00246:68-3862(+)